MFKEPGNILFGRGLSFKTCILYLCCMFASAFVAFGACYAYFSARVELENSVKVGSLSIEYINNTNGAVSNNIICSITRSGITQNLTSGTSKVMPGDVLNVGGAVKNTGTINCYSIIKLSCDTTIDSEDVNLTTIWFTLTGTQINYDNNTSCYNVPATTINANQSFNLTNVNYTIDSLLGNDYENKNFIVTLSIYSIQYDALESEITYSSDAVLATNLMIGD